MLTPNTPESLILSCMRAVCAMDTMTSGGSSEPDMKAVAVMAWASSPTLVVITTTPAANRPIASRKSLDVNGEAGATVALASVCFSSMGGMTNSKRNDNQSGGSGLAATGHGHRLDLDRKSTHLNSTHSQI